MQQLTLARQAEFQRYTKKTRREQFLDEMEAVMPWVELQALVEPYYSKGETGRKPVGLAIRGARVTVMFYVWPKLIIMLISTILRAHKNKNHLAVMGRRRHSPRPWTRFSSSAWLTPWARLPFADFISLDVCVDILRVLQAGLRRSQVHDNHYYVLGSRRIAHLGIPYFLSLLSVNESAAAMPWLVISASPCSIAWRINNRRIVPIVPR